MTVMNSKAPEPTPCLKTKHRHTRRQWNSLYTASEGVFSCDWLARFQIPFIYTSPRHNPYAYSTQANIFHFSLFKS